MAARAYPLLRFRTRVHPAAGDADVLPWRPALRRRPDLQLDPRPEGARADGQHLRLGDDDARVGSRLPLRHRARRTGGDPARGRELARPDPSQTVGPFFSIGLSDRRLDELVPAGTEEAIRVEGRVLDGAGEPVVDAMVEIWQADRGGEYGPGFGWGRSGTDDRGRFGFLTVKPGSVDGQAPHLLLLVFARGLLRPVLTRMYFPDEAEANEADTVLDTVPGSSARRWSRPRTATSCASTSGCRGTTRPRSSTCDVRRRLRPGRAPGSGVGQRVAAGDARLRGALAAAEAKAGVDSRGGRRGDRRVLSHGALRPRRARAGRTRRRRSGRADGAQAARARRRRGGELGALGRDEPGRDGHGRDARGGPRARARPRARRRAPRRARRWRARTGAR